MCVSPGITQYTSIQYSVANKYDLHNCWHNYNHHVYVRNIMLLNVMTVFYFLYSPCVYELLIVFEGHVKSLLRKQKSINITCGDTEVWSVDSVKYLGANLDQSLTGEIMADNVIKKANNKLKFLQKR